MSSSSPQSREFSPDDALPPVEPPSAGFIVQLFVVPGVIVFVVVMIWVMFNWLAQKGNDAEAFVRALARNNEGRWQAAFNLANALRAEHGAGEPRLTVDPQLAKQLAEVLEREIQAGSMEPNAIALRIYLCRALGEFRVPDGLPTLIKAATTHRSDAEADVRRAAIEGIAIGAEHAPHDGSPLADNAQLREAIFSAASDTDARTRSVAAVAMGVIGGDAFLKRLHDLLDDADPNVRYNAATRLAVHGDIAACGVLVEMLDPNEQAGVEIEKQKNMRPFKRAVIMLNALRATTQLAEKNSRDDLGALRAAVDSLLKSKDIDRETRVEATATLRHLNEHAAKAAE